ncbi:MAG: cell division protein FtsK [Ponticaulis sp.]|nr:cell division protein FtsK [Ponticaulis sp.]|tara:strand:+ start:40389 stop:42827 length:2439 start_codon:yes stop_codon:yes gene_type:complete
MTTSNTATVMPNSQSRLSGEPVWRILTGFAIFALGVFLVGSVGSYNPQDPSFNAATDQEITNLFGAAGAATADVLNQSLGWGAMFGAFLVFSAGIKRMLLIGEADPTKWVLGGLSVLVMSACLAGWPVPKTWVLAASLGGMVGDVFFGLAAIPFKALQIPTPELFATVFLGLATLLLVSRASNLGNEDLNLLLRLLWRNLLKVLGLIFFPLKPLGNWLGGLLVSGVTGAKSWFGGLFTPSEPVPQYGKGGFAPDPDQDLDYFDYTDAQKSKGAAPKSAKSEPARAAEPKTTPVKERRKPKEKARPRVSKPGLPSLDLLVTPPERSATMDEQQLLERAEHLMRILSEFGVKGRITHVRPGPVVTLFELEPAAGVKSSRVIALADDVARSMSATSARIAVVPGKNAIGIELPNKGRETVYLRTLLESPSFTDGKQSLPMALGEDIGGEPVCADLAKMPHLLIAGTTGSGKSVGINAMILSLMYKLPPEKCRFIMVDPKMLELSIYEGIPHLLSPVVIDPKKAVTALKWAVREMESRYEMMSKAGVRNLAGFNEKVEELKRTGGRLTKEVQTGFEADTGRPVYETEEIPLEQVPNIVIVIDEMADLMMVAGKEIEACIQRLAQMARAAGIHLITATQRPSVDVITGTIKANFPTRISYMVSSKIDSRTILNEQGAEQLLGMGDLLYMASGGKIKRLHGPFVSDEEVGEIVEFLKSTGEPEYADITEEPDDDPSGGSGSAVMDAMLGTNEESDLLQQAIQVVVRDGRASTSYVQRRLKIGYNRAASLIEQMEDMGIISAPNHAGKREILKKRDGED